MIRKDLIDYDPDTNEWIFHPKNLAEYCQCQLWLYNTEGGYVQADYDFWQWMESNLAMWHKAQEHGWDSPGWLVRYSTELDFANYLKDQWQKTKDKGGRHE